MKGSKYNKQNTSPKDADKRLEQMAKLSKAPKDAFAIERLRAKNKEELQKNEDNRIKARIHHSQGERTGLSQESVKETDQIYKNRADQFKNKTYSKAKEIYKNHGGSVSSAFSTSKLKHILKHDFEQKKQSPKQKNIELSNTFNLSKEHGKLKFDFDKYKAWSKAKEQDNSKSDHNKNKGLDMER